MRSLLFLALIAFAIPAGLAQDKKKPLPKNEPRVLMTLPLAVPAGKSSKLTLRGANLDTATEVKVTTGKGSIKILNKGKAAVPDKNPEKVGDTQIEIELKLEKSEIALQVVVVTPTGESPPYAILVESEVAAVDEKEPNDSFLAAQPISIPNIIAGTVQRAKDVDIFRIDGKAGQKLNIEAMASRHGSPLDAVLTLYDAKFQVIAVNDDFAKEHRDAKIETTLPADGVYYLTLIDAHDSGSNLHVYRLRLK